eukprot:TRINITY_DN15123_c0_g1_i1.p1 TRINITY_DN15123_c0_g1~~TRINITY_DN15123_c0_g1_i1.p1  ORF type:complete len:214 (-),score=42.69 TRINITY_DN15123_c0_g1_i1:26-667(-)
MQTRKKAFVRWANSILCKVDHYAQTPSIENVDEDLKDGIVICLLLEVLSGEKVIHSYYPKTLLDEKANAFAALTFLQKEGVEVNGITTRDFGKEEPMLKLLWLIISEYQLSSSKADILAFVRKQIACYSLPKVTNFTTDWKSGVFLFALVNATLPGDTPRKRSGDALADIEAAMDFALEEFNAPQLFEPEDLINNPDECSLLLYISYIKDYAF